MPKYWGKQIFSLGSFPEVGQKQKTERERERFRARKMIDSDFTRRLEIGRRATPSPWSILHILHQTGQTEVDPKIIYD